MALRSGTKIPDNTETIDAASKGKLLQIGATVTGSHQNRKLRKTGKEKVKSPASDTTTTGTGSVEQPHTRHISDQGMETETTGPNKPVEPPTMETVSNSAEKPMVTEPMENGSEHEQLERDLEEGMDAWALQDKNPAALEREDGRAHTTAHYRINYIPIGLGGLPSYHY